MIVVLMAWRNIWRNKVRSLIIMGSVAIGLTAGLFVLSIYKGVLEDRIRAVIEREVSHIQVHHPKFKDDYDAKYIIDDPANLLDILASDPRISNITTRTIGQGMVTTGTGSSGLQIIGIDAGREDEVSQLNAKIIEGTTLAGKRRNEVLIGRKLADKMHLRINSKIILTFTDRESNIVSGAFRIAGIYSTENAPRDERIAYVMQSDLNRLLAMDGQFHEVAILLKNDGFVESVEADLKDKFQNAKVESWREISPETSMMINTTEQYSHIFIAIIMLALSFGIINTMLMAVLERTKEIGMLLAVGMNRYKVFLMILTETIFLTIGGVPLGILLCWSVVLYYHQHGLDISSIGGNAMAQFGFASVMYPTFPWGKILREMTTVMGAAMLSSLIPAIHAIKLRPVEALQK